MVNVLLGTTDAGKTALMRLMAGLDRPAAGRVTPSGQNVTGVSVRERDLAMVYRQFITYPSFTVFEDGASPLRIQRVPEKEIRKRVTEMAERLPILPYLQRTPAELSGGQQHRTALAGALMKGAGLLLLGLRAHSLNPEAESAADFPNEARIELAEVSGSETYLPLGRGPVELVCTSLSRNGEGVRWTTHLPGWHGPRRSPSFLR